MRDGDLLAVSLGDMERTGWRLDSYLKTQKDLSDSVVVSLLAADRIRRAPRPIPSDEFRRRARSSFVSLVQEQAIGPLTVSPPNLGQRLGQLLVGPLLGPLVAIILAMSGAVVGLAAESALPESPLYPAKTGTEWLAGMAAMTPTEQAQFRLRIAASRLAEADSEQSVGNAPGARALLRQFDAELARATAIVTSHGLEDSSVVAIGRQITDLETKRELVSVRVGPSPLLARASDATGSNASDPAKVGGVLAATDDPKRPPTVAPAVVESAQSPAAGATVVASESMTKLPDNQTDPGVALIDRSVRLSKLLIDQVQAGDGDRAMATAQEFADVTRELTLSMRGVTEVLRQEQRSLVACLPMATASSRGALLVALTSIDEVLGGEAMTSRPELSNKALAKGRMSAKPSVVSVPESSKKASRVRPERSVANVNPPTVPKASISLPAFSVIGVILGPVPLLPPTPASPGAPSPSDHAAKGDNAANSHAAEMNSFKARTSSGPAAAKQVDRGASQPIDPKLDLKGTVSHSAPTHPSEPAVGAVRLLVSVPARAP